MENEIENDEIETAIIINIARMKKAARDLREQHLYDMESKARKLQDQISKKAGLSPMDRFENVFTNFVNSVERFEKLIKSKKGN